MTEAPAEEAPTEEPTEAAIESETSVTEETETESKEEAEAPSVIYQADAADIYVTVEAPADALPEDAVLHVKYYGEDTDEYKAAADLLGIEDQTEEPEETAKPEEGKEEAAVEKTTCLETLDIYFEADEQIIEPSGQVSVKINISRILAKDPDVVKKTLKAWHFVTVEDGTPAVVLVADRKDKSEGTIDIGKSELAFASAGLQRFAVTWTDETIEEERESETDSESETEAKTEIEIRTGADREYLHVEDDAQVSITYKESHLEEAEDGSTYVLHYTDDTKAPTECCRAGRNRRIQTPQTRSGEIKNKMNS